MTENCMDPQLGTHFCTDCSRTTYCPEKSSVGGCFYYAVYSEDDCDFVGGSWNPLLHIDNACRDVSSQDNVTCLKPEYCAIEGVSHQSHKLCGSFHFTIHKNSCFLKIVVSQDWLIFL